MLRRAAIVATLVIAGCPAPIAAPPTATPRTDDAPPPRDPPPPTLTGLDPVAAALLAAHNRVRATHCAGPLAWSPTLADEAAAWAQSLAANDCAFEHSSSPHGENLAAGTASALGPDEVVAMWADEVAAYDFRRPRFGMNTGHFTQVVWKGTRQLGCGTATCKGLSLWVCNYDPPGNVDGDFPANVRPGNCR